MEFSNVFVILGCIVALLVIGKIFSIPFRAIVKLIVNSFLGGLLIFIINLVGTSFGFHIGLNVGTALLVGVLGVPGAILLIVLKFFL